MRRKVNTKREGRNKGRKEGRKEGKKKIHENNYLSSFFLS